MVSITSIFCYLKLTELFLGDLIIPTKFFVLSLVDLDNPVSLQKRFGQEPLCHGGKPGPDHWQVDTVDGHVITGRALTSRLTPAVDGDGARDVTHRHGVAVFLHFHFLQEKKCWIVAIRP